MKWLQNFIELKERWQCKVNKAYPPTPAKRNGKGEIFLREDMRREAIASPDTSPATMNTLSSPSLDPISATDLLLLLVVEEEDDDEKKDLSPINNILLKKQLLLIFAIYSICLAFLAMGFF